MSDAKPEEEDPVEEALCLGCLEVVQEDQLICHKCGCPQDFLSATLPYVRVLAEGYLLRQAVGAPRRIASVVGLWILFGMMVLQGAFSVYLLIEGYDYYLPMDRAMNLAIAGGSIAIGTSGIYPCMSNFRRHREAAEAAETA